MEGTPAHGSGLSGDILTRDEHFQVLGTQPVLQVPAWPLREERRWTKAVSGTSQYCKVLGDQKKLPAEGRGPETVLTNFKEKGAHGVLLRGPVARDRSLGEEAGKPS